MDVLPSLLIKNYQRWADTNAVSHGCVSHHRSLVQNDGAHGLMNSFQIILVPNHRSHTISYGLRCPNDCAPTRLCYRERNVNYPVSRRES